MTLAEGEIPVRRPGATRVVSKPIDVPGAADARRVEWTVPAGGGIDAARIVTVLALSSDKVLVNLSMGVSESQAAGRADRRRRALAAGRLAMGAHGNLPLLGEAGDRRWLARGIAAGAVAMIAAVLVAMFFITAFIGDAGQGWAERGTLTAVLFTALWAVNAAGAGAIGAWQAAESGAPHTAAARFAGAFGPVALIVLVTVASLGGDGASPATVLVEGIVEVAAAVAGADALARRLEAGW